MTTTLRILLSSLLCAQLAACAADEDETQPAPRLATLDDVLQANQTNDVQMHLLTRITLGDNHVVEFYEPSPGLIVQSETGRVPIVPRLDASLARLAPTQLYRALAPARHVPPELVAAEQRAEALVPLLDAKPRRPTGHDDVAERGGEVAPALTGGSCPSEWYRANGYGCDVGGPIGGTFNWCLLDWWNGRSTWSGSGSDAGISQVCADIGSVMFEMHAETGTGQWTVPQGWWRRAYTGDTWCFPWLAPCNQRMQFDVTHAIGSRFHTSGWFWDI